MCISETAEIWDRKYFWNSIWMLRVKLIEYLRSGANIHTNTHFQVHSYIHTEPGHGWFIKSASARLRPLHIPEESENMAREWERKRERERFVTKTGSDSCHLIIESAFECVSAEGVAIYDVYTHTRTHTHIHTQAKSLKATWFFGCIIYGTFEWDTYELFSTSVYGAMFGQDHVYGLWHIALFALLNQLFGNEVWRRIMHGKKHNGLSIIICYKITHFFLQSH